MLEKPNSLTNNITNGVINFNCIVIRIYLFIYPLVLMTLALFKIKFIYIEIST